VIASPIPPAYHDVKQSLLARIVPITNSIVGKIGLDCPAETFRIGNGMWVYPDLSKSNYGGLNAVLIQPDKSENTFMKPSTDSLWAVDGDDAHFPLTHIQLNE